MTAAGGAILQGIIRVTAVYLFSWWLSGKCSLPDTLRAVMSTAVSDRGGTVYGETAQKTASIVKQTQNALIGGVAFLLSLCFTAIVEGKKERPSAMLIWNRFPKFLVSSSHP